MRIHHIVLLGVLFLSGCGGEGGSASTPEKIPSEGINFYATNAGNFGRAFMLASAYSGNIEKTIITTGLNLPTYEFRSPNGAEFKVIGQDNSYTNISNLIVENASASKENNLYLGVISISDGQKLTTDAFKSIDNIYIVPEGTSIFVYQNWRIDNIISFAKIAKENGVKNVKLILWDSINKSEISNSSAEIKRLPENGVDYEFFSFDNMADKIKSFKTTEGLLSTAIYSGAINPSITDNDIFIRSRNFDDKKESVVFIGSYTRNDINTSKTNQIEILKKLEKTIDHQKFNLIFKGHPSEISVNDWISNNTDISSASYFKSFPYELWQIIGGGEHKYSYNGVTYNLFLPKAPTEIYSVFSTSLYAEKSDKITKIIGYNKVISNDGEFILTNEVDPSAVEDIAEYNRWSALTKNIIVPFKMAYAFINDQ
ncbi:hypothetical protein [Aeromonas veronii]|uniref:hypothetical protein n=1 Tax=Aeromonas veronii TaxID=654 RepID=UPI00293705A0|nr:hypothetical protein [Aeromonas veronii]WOE86642.1 hypothetical protein RY930_09805 [Aeromonas veronii]